MENFQTPIPQALPERTRLLLNIKRLCKHYGITELYVNQKDDDELVSLPPKYDIYIPLKCYISYDPVSKQLYISQRLINRRNHWLNTLKSDLANGRLDYHEYC